jgi:predicted RNase H-like nuclease (RuvC/YqgF family)
MKKHVCLRQKRFCVKQKKEFLANILNVAVEEDTDSKFDKLAEATVLPRTTVEEDTLKNEVAALKSTIDALKMENSELKKVNRLQATTVSKMRRTIKYLKSKTFSKKMMEKKIRIVLSSDFTSSQLDLILCNKKRVNSSLQK